jgi:glutamate-1-semialdehyde 2,1-aminomutase
LVIILTFIEPMASHLLSTNKNIFVMLTIQITARKAPAHKVEVSHKDDLMKPRPRSQELYQKMCQHIPGGVNSPVRACKGVDQLPMIIERGKGDTITDVDGHQYIDYCGSWGALIHGHAHPEIIAAAHKQIAMGTTFGISSGTEAEIAELVTALVPSVEAIRFVSSGTEATMSAIRLARGYTGRELIVKFDGNYHGHADFLLVKAGSGLLEVADPTSFSAGIPAALVQHTISLPYNDIDRCRQLLLDPAFSSRVAAVILEPIPANMGVVPPVPGFLESLRQLTTEIGALLIFDEVITGFRVGLRGAQGLYGITPDLSCFGKIIGGGFPAAAFGGQRRIMECLAPIGNVYQAGTLSGNPVAMGAGLRTLSLLQQKGFYEQLDAATQMLTAPVEAFLAANPKIQASLQRVGSMFTLFFGKRHITSLAEAQQCDNQQFGRFFRFMFDRGVYIPPLQWEAWFISAAHTDHHLRTTSKLIIEFLDSHVRNYS